MKLLERLFVPELAGSLKQTQLERDWFEERAANAEIRIKELESEAAVNKQLFTTTTQHLISEILKLAGGKPIPRLETDEDKKKAVDLEDFELTAEQKNLLRMRATDAAGQKVFDREVTDADIDAEYEAMMQNPHYYLID